MADAAPAQAVVFVGIQAVGKSTFFRERFALSHVRINLDSLRTRHREAVLLEVCARAGIPFCVDNTNPSAGERVPYLAAARAAGFRVAGYYFASRVAPALERNAARPAAERVPEVGIKGTAGRLERPRLDEGFDELFYVRIDSGGGFLVEAWNDEV